MDATNFANWNLSAAENIRRRRTQKIHRSRLRELFSRSLSVETCPRLKIFVNVEHKQFIGADCVNFFHEVCRCWSWKVWLRSDRKVCQVLNKFIPINSSVKHFRILFNRASSNFNFRLTQKFSSPRKVCEEKFVHVENLKLFAKLATDFFTRIRKGNSENLKSFEVSQSF